MSDLKVHHLPFDSALVPITPGEAFAWMFARGRVMTIERDGVLYRVLEPEERHHPETTQERSK
jgi:uncharacterized protein YcaQ